MRTLIILTYLLGTVSLRAQSLMSISQNNLSGIYGTLSNPALGAGGIDRFSFNLIGVGAAIQNNALRSDLDYDYFRIKSKTPLLVEPGSIEKASFTTARKWVINPKIHTNLDALQLGAQVALNKKVTVFGFTRERAFANFDKTDYSTIEFLASENFNHKQGIVNMAFDIRSIAYQELGIGGAAVLHDKRKNFIKAGVTYKLLNGRTAYAASLEGFESRIEGNRIKVNSTMNLISTSLNLATQNPIDFILKPQIGRGNALDIGLVYEYRPYSKKHTYRRNNPNTKSKHFNQKNKIKYHYRLGVSILDLGSIAYKNSVVSALQYNVDAAYDPLDLATMNSEDYLESLTDSASYSFQSGPIAFNLPTTLNINYDLSLVNNWFFSVNYSQNMVRNTLRAIYIPSNLLIQMRKENEKCVYGFPLQIVPGTRTVNLGANIQAGPFFIGTNNIATLWLDKIYNPSIYCGLFYNIRYRKDKTIENYRSFKTKKRRKLNWSGM